MSLTVTDGRLYGMAHLPWRVMPDLDPTVGGQDAPRGELAPDPGLRAAIRGERPRERQIPGDGHRIRLAAQEGAAPADAPGPPQRPPPREPRRRRLAGPPPRAPGLPRTPAGPAERGKPPQREPGRQPAREPRLGIEGRELRPQGG